MGVNTHPCQVKIEQGYRNLPLIYRVSTVYLPYIYRN